jgi:hypothetical protein
MLRDTILPLGKTCQSDSIAGTVNATRIQSLIAVELDLEEDCHQKAWVKMYLN